MMDGTTTTSTAQFAEAEQLPQRQPRERRRPKVDEASQAKRRRTEESVHVDVNGNDSGFRGVSLAQAEHALRTEEGAGPRCVS